jgi:PadR family transcriptional regulator PadR
MDRYFYLTYLVHLFIINPKLSRYLGGNKMSGVARELVAASSKMIILTILIREENYGYKILESIKLLTEGVWVWKEGMLYPMLHKMEKDKLIRSYWSETPGGKKRKYYQITDIGFLELQKEKTEWKFVNATLGKLWRMEVC